MPNRKILCKECIELAYINPNRPIRQAVRKYGRRDVCQEHYEDLKKR